MKDNNVLKVICLLLMILSFSYSQDPDNDDIQKIVLEDNLVHHYDYEVGRSSTLTIEVSVDIDKNFPGEKKGIILSTDCIDKNLNVKMAPKLYTETEAEKGYENLDLFAFKFRWYKGSQEYPDYEKIIITINNSGSSKKYFNLKIEATDEGIVFNSGERKDRIFQTIFTFGYNDPFYIINSYPRGANNQQLYVDQLTGQFRIYFMNKASETHLLPNKNDFCFEPIQNHSKILDTNWEILHLVYRTPGLAKISFINTDRNKKIDSDSSVLAYVENNDVNLEPRIDQGKKVYVKLEKVFGEEKIKCTVGSEEQELDSVNKIKYLGPYDSINNIKISSSKKGYVIVTVVRDDLWKSEQMGKEEKTFKGVKYIMLIFPRYMKRDKEDYSSVSIEITKDESSNLATYEGKEKADKLLHVPDPEKNGYTIVDKDITDYLSFQLKNPYDSQNVEDDEAYFLLIVNHDQKEIKVTPSYVLKDFSQKYDTEEQKYFYVTAEGDWEKTYMIQRSTPKSFGMLVLVHSCSFKNTQNYDSFTLGYFAETYLYSKYLMTEYQAFKLTNDYYDEDIQIFRNNEHSQYGDFIVNYYLFKEKQSFLDYPTPREINKKIWFLKSRSFVFELNGYKLEWYSNLGTGDSSSQVKVESTSYFVCILEDTLINSAYAGNECYIESLLKENKVKCHKETSSFTTLNEGLRKSIVVVYEEDDMLIKARYPIGVFFYGGKEEDEEEGEKEGEEHKVGEFNELLKTQSLTYSEKTKAYFYCNFSNSYEDENLIIHAQTSNIDGYISEGKLKVVVLATNKNVTESVFKEALEGDTSESRVYKPIIRSYNNLVYTAIVVDKPYSIQFEQTYVIFYAENLVETFRIYKIGSMQTRTIYDNLLKSENIECESLGTPIYIKFEIPDTNFQKDKKGIVLLTDIIDKNAGSIGVYAGLPSENKDEKFPPFINSRLSAFKFRQYDGNRECSYVTVIFIPSVKNEIVYIRVQTTDEGLVIHREERINRIYKVQMFTGYQEPFYMVGAYNFGANAFLYIEQLKGLFEFSFLDKPESSHIFPLDTDKRFEPVNDTFTKLYEKYEIIHIKPIYPGSANLYYATTYNDTELIVTEYNSATNLVVKQDQELKVQIPTPEEKGVTIYIKIRCLVSKGTEPTKIKIENPTKDAEIKPKEEKTIEYTPSSISENPVIIFKSSADTILTLTVVYGNIWKKIITEQTSDLTERYLLYKFPKDLSIASYLLKIECLDQSFYYQVKGSFISAKDTKYIPDPSYDINKAVVESSSYSQGFVILLNPYDQFGITSEEENYYYAISFTYPTENISPYKLIVEPTKKPSDTTLVKQNELHYYKNNDAKREIVQLETKEISKVPQGLTVFVYTCNFKENSNNVLRLYYGDSKIEEKKLTYAYFIHNTQNTFNGMNMQLSSEGSTKYNFIVSYLYADEYQQLDDIDYYRKKMSALESEKYTFFFDEENRELSWFCSTCYSDASEKFSINIQYMVCKANPSLISIDEYENQCKIQELIDSGKIQCTTQKESEETDLIKLDEEDLSKVILLYKISENPVLMRNFMGFYKYAPEEQEEDEGVVGEFYPLKIGKKYNVTKGKYYLELPSYEMWELNTGVISIFNATIKPGSVRGGFGTSYESKSESVLQEILDNGNAAIQEGEYAAFKEKITQIVYMRESGEDSDYYFVLEFNFEQKIEIYVNAPFKVLTLNDNKFKSYTIDFKEAFTTAFVRVNIHNNNFMGDKKGLFIYIDDIEQGVGTHDVFLTSILAPEQLKSDYPLTAYKFRKFTDQESGDSQVDYDYALIRLYCKKPRSKVHVRIQSTDEGIVVLQDRVSRQFTVGFTYNYNNDFYLVTTNKDLGEEYAVYIEQESGKFQINAITEASVSHILPGKNDLIFEPLEGHYLKIPEYFCIMHITLKQYGNAMFHFIVSPSDLTILENSVNTIIVRESKTLSLPEAFGSNYNIKAELISGASAKIGETEFTKDKPYRKLGYNSQKLTIASNEKRTIVRLTVITNDNLYPEVIEETRGGLTAQYLLVKYPRTKENKPYSSIQISLTPEDESADDMKYGLIQVIESEKGFIPDPVNSGIFAFRGENLFSFMNIMQANPYDQYSIKSDESYYMAIKFANRTVPKYKIEIETESEEKTSKIIYAPPGTIKKIPYSLQETYALNMEKEQKKSKYVSIFAHSCNFDSKAEESTLIGISYYESEILWGASLNREYEAFTISNEYGNMNIVLLAGKSEKQLPDSDFLLSYYYSDSSEGLDSDKLNLKLDKLRGMKFPLFRKDNKISWTLNTKDSDSGEDGTGVQAKNRQYLVCEVKKSEMRDRRKNYFNGCYFNDKYITKQIKCKTTYDQYIDEKDVDLKNNVLIIYQEVEIPLKIRLFLGIFDTDIQIDNGSLKPDGKGDSEGGSSKKNEGINKAPYILLMIFFGICILIIGIVVVKIYLEMRSASASNQNDNAVSMTMDNVNSSDVNQINDDPDDNIVK